MKKNYIFILVLISAVLLTGCGSSTNEEKNDAIKKTLSCYNEGHLFYSKKSVEHIISLDNENKLVQYEHIERYFDFTSNSDFDMICEGAPEEAKNNNKLYPHLKEVANCNKETREVEISDLYVVSKLESKTQLPSDELENALDDNYVLDLKAYKEAISKKGYSCVEK